MSQTLIKFIKKKKTKKERKTFHTEKSKQTQTKKGKN